MTPAGCHPDAEFADVCAPPELDTIPDADPVDDGDFVPVVEEPVDGDASAAEPDDASPTGDDVCESADGEVPVSEGLASATPWPVATAVPIPRATANPPTRAIFAAEFVTVPPGRNYRKKIDCRRFAGRDLLHLSRRDAHAANVTDTGTRGGLNTKNSFIRRGRPVSAGRTTKLTTGAELDMQVTQWQIAEPPRTVGAGNVSTTVATTRVGKGRAAGITRRDFGAAPRHRPPV